MEDDDIDVEDLGPLDQCVRIDGNNILIFIGDDLPIIFTRSQLRFLAKHGQTILTDEQMKYWPEIFQAMYKVAEDKIKLYKKLGFKN